MASQELLRGLAAKGGRPYPASTRGSESTDRHLDIPEHRTCRPRDHAVATHGRISGTTFQPLSRRPPHQRCTQFGYFRFGGDESSDQVAHFFISTMPFLPTTYSSGSL